MELIIRSISQVSPDYCTEIMHMVIKPLCLNLRSAIDNKNAAQQVILLNLLKVILFENESLFYKTQSRSDPSNLFYSNSARRLFEDQELFKCFTLGLKNEGAFIRYHYIQFTQKLVPLMQKLISPEVLAIHVGSLVDTFAQLLNKADISAYDIQVRAGKNLLSGVGEADEDEEEAGEADEEGSKVIIRASQLDNGEELNFVINQENDIVQLLEGFLQILDHCLGTKRRYDSLEEQEILRNRQLLGRDRLRNRGIFDGFFGIFSSETEETQPEMSAVLQDKIYEKSEIILTSCINCWNDIDIYRSREFFFTTLGMFSYNVDDKIQMEKQIKSDEGVANHLQKRDNYINTDGAVQTEKDKSSEDLLTIYLYGNFNSIQMSVVQLLKDFTKKEPIKMVKGLLHIWEANMKLDTKDSRTAKKHNQICEKVIQMILSLQVPAHTVIAAVNSFADEERTYKDQKWKQQSRLCHFIYTYLMHNVEFINLRMQILKDGAIQQEEEFKEKKIDLYKATVEFIDRFKSSKHPNTICWLIEILHILTSKFSPPTNLSLYTRLTSRMDTILQYLLTSASLVLESDLLTIQEMRDCILRDVHLSPSVYELLKRFEFNQQKRPQELMEDEQEMRYKLESEDTYYNEQ